MFVSSTTWRKCRLLMKFSLLALLTAPLLLITSSQAHHRSSLLSGSRSPCHGLFLAGKAYIDASHISSVTSSGSIHLYIWWSSTAFHHLPVSEPVAPLDMPLLMGHFYLLVAFLGMSVLFPSLQDPFWNHFLPTTNQYLASQSTINSDEVWKNFTWKWTFLG